MIAFVDEWGNPSPTGVGTEWFGFAAIFLKEIQIEKMRHLYSYICENLRRKPDTPLHLYKFGLNNKYHIVKLIAQANISISIVAVLIHEIKSRQLQQKGWAYRFYAKEIVRSATHFAADCNELATVVFHRHKYLENFEDYIRDQVQFSSSYMMKSDSKQIKFDRLINIYSADDEDELLLFFADCVAHACNIALNPDNVWKQVNPACLNLLTNCIWKGPSYDRNACLFGIQLKPWRIPVGLIHELPDAIRQYWE